MAEATSPLTTGQGRALQVLGHLFLRMGQFQRARKLALALLALDPADLWARRCLAVAWLELGDPDGFVFNMSVGYDLKGIQSPKVDAYIEVMPCCICSEPVPCGRRSAPTRPAMPSMPILPQGEAACEPVLRRTQHRLPDHAPQ